jgi:hypothetical protein
MILFSAESIETKLTLSGERKGTMSNRGGIYAGPGGTMLHGNGTVAPSAGRLGSEWSDWGILVSFPDRPLRRISETVKARSKDEAERKAAKFLSGRGTLLFEVIEPNTPDQTRPASSGAVG